LPSTGIRIMVRGWTCSTLSGLIVVTGLRASEAIGLA
jgi:hypothetical protein